CTSILCAAKMSRSRIPRGTTPTRSIISVINTLAYMRGTSQLSPLPSTLDLLTGFRIPASEQSLMPIASHELRAPTQLFSSSVQILTLATAPPDPQLTHSHLYSSHKADLECFFDHTARRGLGTVGGCMPRVLQNRKM